MFVLNVGSPHHIFNNYTILLRTQCEMMKTSLGGRKMLSFLGFPSFPVLICVPLTDGTVGLGTVAQSWASCSPLGWTCPGNVSSTWSAALLLLR